jgi:hypothetical protein
MTKGPDRIARHAARDGNDPFRVEGVVTNLERLAQLPVQTIPKIAVADIRLDASPGASPVAPAAWSPLIAFLSAS